MAQGKTNQTADFTRVNYSFTWYFRINWSETYDVASNTSDVTITSIQMKGNWSGRTYNGDLLVRINDSQTAAINLSANSLNNGVYNGSQDSFQTIVRDPLSDPTPITAVIRGIPHSADGSGSIKFSLEKNNYDAPMLYSPYGSASFNAGSITQALTTIPRASNFTVSGTTIGSAMTFSISRASSAFTHKLEYRFGSSGNWTQITTGAGASYSWTIPASLGGSIPTATSGSWQLRCTTYNGGTQIGDPVVKDVTLVIPSDAGPTGDAGWYSAGYTNSGFPASASGITAAVTGYSKLTWSINDSKIHARYGATISTKKAYIGSTEVTSGTYTLTAASTSVRFVVTDSRGKTLTYTETVSALAYSQPSLGSAEAKRCDSSGNEATNGTYWYAKATANYASINGQNSAQLTAAIKPAGGAYGAAITLMSGVKSAAQGGALSITASYVVRIRIEDLFGNTAAAEFTIPTDEVTLNFKPGGKGAAFGQYAQTDNLLDVKWDLLVQGNAMGRVLGLGEAREQITTGGNYNSYTEPGIYGIANDTIAGTLSNKPDSLGGTLRVWNSLGDAKNPGDAGFYVLQEKTAHTGQTYRRKGYASGGSIVWESWVSRQEESGAGYCKLPEGTLIQWGQAGGYDGVTEKNFTVTMSYAFINTSYIVSVTNSLGTLSTIGSYDQRINTVVISSTTEFTVHQKVLNGNPVNQFHWIAIGRWK